MATLPAQIQRQIDQADAILKTVNSAPEPAQSPVAEPAVSVQPPEAEAPAAAPTAPTEDAPRKDTEETWEARYKTLQGMHNRSARDFREMKAQFDALSAQVNTLAAENNELKKAQPPAQPLVDPKDSEVFGSDLVEMVTRVAERMFGNAAQALDKRISALEGRLTGTTKAVAQTAESVFLTDLKSQVPDYEAINQDEQFLLWLGEEDPVYGVPRQQALTVAAEKLDAARVAKIFLAFKATRATPQQKTTAAAQLERQTSPAPSATAQPQLRTQPGYITTADVRAFYDDVRLGKFKGRADEQAHMEAVINSALAQNRIVDRVPRNANI